LAIWGLRGAWALAVALWALALVPWFRTAPAPPRVHDVAQRAMPRNGAAAPEPTRETPDQAAAGEPAEPTRIAPSQRGEGAIEPVAAPVERAGRAGAVCGLNDGVDAAAVDAPSASQKASHVLRQAQLGLQQAFEALRAHTEIPAQAAGWWLRVLLAREGADSSSSPACAAGNDCAAAAAMPPPAVAVDALAQLAQSSADAWVQQIAQRACDGATPASALCASLGARRWSTHEPDNAAAWLELAARDAQAIDEALFRAGKASRFDSRRGRLTAWVVQATAEQLPAMQRYAAWQRSDELERAADARAMTAAARPCSESARRDANRDQLCDGALRWLTAEARAPAAAEPPFAARVLDCATIDRQWREARDNAQRDARIATSAAATRRP